ncbi:MAG: c-type cytochrome [Myxococcota bacterium]|jgi:mono/diheme cytochrome c family protein|nr:c-type cytochrome [Myxococcota bacterium]
MTLASMVLLACGDDDVAADAHVPALDGGSGDADAGRRRDAGPPVAPVDRPPLAAANAVGPEDPELYDGMLRFLYDAFGAEAVSHWPPPDFFLRLMEDEPEVFGDQFRAFGFVRDPNDDFPVGFKRGLDDPTKMKETCAICHVARLPDGRVWLGAPNGALDFAGFTVAVNERWVAEGHESFLSALEESKLRELGPGRFGAESGEYPQVVPADFPPYFGLGDRDRLNYLGTGRDVRSEVYLSLFSAGVGNPNPEDARVAWPPAARVDPFVRWMGAMAAPEGPPQSATLVARGREVFREARCASCHVDDPAELGVVPYAPDGIERHPDDDEAFPEGTIATSRFHRILIDGDEMGGGMPSDEGRAALVTFIFRNMLRVSPSDGYRVADLRGVWSTAPYLHNGSVPTLEALLAPPDARPTTFDRHGFTVDTMRAGNGNEGHDFGTDLSEDDRSALVAYLRTL